MYALANVIFPPLWAANLIQVTYLGIPALLAEIIVFQIFQKISFLKASLLVIGANIVSLIAGFIFTSILSILRNTFFPVYSATNDPYFTSLAIASFPIACLLSIGIEFILLKQFQQKFHLRDLFLCMAIANLVSYTILGITVWISFLK
ncbi:MAG TPA: hypothetical protein DCY88_01975 [Cyanobacteria bacterium UBA11372]|nr:hypothetical protein [Cyanobacteria bacterium UBA11372]